MKRIIIVWCILGFIGGILMDYYKTDELTVGDLVRNLVLSEMMPILISIYFLIKLFKTDIVILKRNKE
jgi:hypothetical protein